MSFGLAVVGACSNTISGTALPNTAVATSLSREHSSSSAAATSLARVRATMEACRALTAYDDASVTAYNALVEALNAAGGWWGSDVDGKAAASVTAYRDVAQRIDTALQKDADQAIAALLREIATKYRAQVDLILAHGSSEAMNVAKDAIEKARDAAWEACDNY
ncbi:hypothetical protein [Nocardia concava]|uniref:hypothetical protein n=1 Tax=Nocardia concava TaxID=257281 RepID=UPI00030C7557|nr:hypothetical protein [Nocardia concava]